MFLSPNYLLHSLRVLGIVLIIVGASISAKADIWLGLGAFYNSTETTTSPGGSTSKENKTYLDYQIGYIFENGVYLGGFYDSDTIDKGGSTKDTITDSAGTLGYYFKSHWYIHASYIASAEYAFSGGSKWNKGTGSQFDLGWRYELSAPFGIAFQISQRSIEFKNYNNGTIDDPTQSYKLNEIFPMMKFVFVF